MVLDARIADAERTLRDALDEKRDEVITDHRESLDALAQRWNEATEEARKLLEPIWEDIQTEHAAFAKELTDAMPDLADYPLPEPPEAEPALAESALYFSGRTYWQQLAVTKNYLEEHGVSAE